MIRRILVALSGTPFTPSAVQHGVELARLHGAELTGVTLVDARRIGDVGPVPLGGGAAAHGLAEQRVHLTEERIEAEVAAFETACRETGVPHRVLREEGDLFQRFISCWRYHDLTIVGLRGLFEYGLAGEGNDRIVHLVTSGVRPMLAVAQQHRVVRRVLIAYNGSLEAAKAMKRFVQMRLWPEPEIRLAYVGPSDAESDSLLHDAADYVRAHGYAPETENVAGDPVPALLDHARRIDADLVVMGATTRRRLARMILGDTVLHAMQNAEISLFLSR